MSNVSNGVVEAVRKDDKGLMIAGTWYSSFNAFSGISKSDVVSFNFTEKGQWKNIKGPIEKVTGIAVGSESVSQPSTASAIQQELPPHYMIAKGYMNKVQSFPIPVDHPDRAIVRQNSLTNAVNMCSQIPALGDSTEAIAEEIIKVACIFEKYSTGQLEMEAAVEAVAAMTKSPE